MNAKGVEEVLSKYVPQDSLKAVVALMKQHPCRFIISKPRKSKLGDFRKLKDETPTITVNGDLNPYAFLITTIHEFAHLRAFEQFGNRIKAHGSEWQGIYSELMLKFIDLRVFPIDIEKALVNSLVRVKASSCTDLKLYRVLSNYDDKKKNEGATLESLDIYSHFILNGKQFEKGKLRRSRYECVEKSTQKVYLVHALARVQKLNYE